MKPCKFIGDTNASLLTTVVLAELEYYEALYAILILILILEISVTLLSVILSRVPLHEEDTLTMTGNDEANAEPKQNNAKISQSPSEDEGEKTEKEKGINALPSVNTVISVVEGAMRSARGRAVRILNDASQIMATLLAILIIIKNSLQGSIAAVAFSQNTNSSVVL